MIKDIDKIILKIQINKEIQDNHRYLGYVVKALIGKILDTELIDAEKIHLLQIPLTKEGLKAIQRLKKKISLS